MKTDSETRDRREGCPLPEDVVAFAVDGETADEAEAARQHLSRCTPCRAIATDARETLGMLRPSADTPDTRDLVPGILERIPQRAWRDGLHSLRPRNKDADKDNTRWFSLATPRLVRIAAALLVLPGGALLVHRLARSGAEQPVGATAQVNAVGKGIDWLLAKQTASGGWNVEELGGQPEYAPALNGLAILAITRSERSASETGTPLSRAATFLLRGQADDGRFGKDFDGTMYNQGIATLALLETYCVTRDEALRAPIARALTFIRSRQSHSGGWGYAAGRQDLPNTSVTAWQVQSLLLADRLGWRENRVPLRQALHWMSGTVDGRGFFGYERTQHYPEGPNTVTMMGAYCLLATQNLDIPVDPDLKARVVRGVSRLAGETPDDYYGAYFHSSALTEAGPDAFRGALAANRSSLAARQQSAGDGKGTWRADDRWGSAGGRLYSTSMALLALAPSHSHRQSP